MNDIYINKRKNPSQEVVNIKKTRETNNISSKKCQENHSPRKVKIS